MKTRDLYNFYSRAIPLNQLAPRLVFVLLFLAISTSSFAVSKVSTGSGPWDDASTWSPSGVPTAADDVTILATHVVSLPPNTSAALSECNNLLIEAAGLVIANNSSITINGTTDVFGQFIDAAKFGVNIFTGKVTIHSGGIININAVNNVANVRFENGIEHNGVLFEVERCTFQTNNQEIAGTSPIVFPNRVQIASGITVTNNVTAADGITFEAASFIQGDDVTSTFENLTTCFYAGSNAPMSVGVLDADAPGNTFVYNEDAFSQDVRDATYDVLILRDPSGTDQIKVALGDIIVNTRLDIETNTTMEPNGNNLTVNGIANIQGIFKDDVAAGTNTFASVNLSGGLIEGSGGSFGTTNIGSLSIADGDGELKEGAVSVSGTTNIPSGRSLIISNANGTKAFGTTNIVAGGTLDVTVNANATNVVFSGVLTNAGTLNTQRGTYTFSNDFDNDGGTVNAADGSYSFEQAFINDGTYTNAGTAHTFAGNLSGSTATAINSSVDIAASSFVSNNLDLTINGILNGVDAISSLININRLTYNPGNKNIPMLTGILDASFPGNTVEYARTAGNQDVKGGVYNNLIFSNPNALSLNDGDVIVEGDLSSSSVQNGANKIIMRGSAAQTIAGTGTYTEIQISKSANGITVNDDFTVNNALTFVNGIMDTDGNLITLGTSGILTETNSAFLTGLIQTTRNVPSNGVQTFGGLGLTITAMPGLGLGSTNVVRTTGSHIASAAIDRDFDITPTLNSGRNASLEMSYRDSELRTLTEGNLVMLESIAGGALIDRGGLLDPINNTISLSGIDSFDQWTLGDPTAFPVVLLSFDAVPLGENVVLNWATAVEENNDRFEIERSMDGSNFIQIGQQNGAGNSNSVLSYSFTDEKALNLLTDNLYYRLKQVDIDGTASYSNVVALKVIKPSLLSLTAYPSPFEEKATVMIALDDDYKVDVVVFDMAGKVLQQDAFNGKRGANAFTVNGQTLAPGMYMVNVRAGGRVQNLRIVKQ